MRSSPNTCTFVSYVRMESLLRQAKEAAVAKDMEELQSSNPDSPVFKTLEQVSSLIADWSAASHFAPSHIPTATFFRPFRFSSRRGREALPGTIRNSPCHSHGRNETVSRFTFHFHTAAFPRCGFRRFLLFFVPKEKAGSVSGDGPEYPPFPVFLRKVSLMYENRI